MIYMIGGAPRCGKTILARRLAKELGISWISADTLESIAKSYVPLEKQAAMFPKDEIREKTKSSNDIMYTEFSADQICDAYIAQSKVTRKAVSMLIECMISDGEGIIIEGHQLHPELMDELAKNFGAKNIRAVVLIKNNVDQIVETARAGKETNDWFIKKTTDPTIHYKIAEMIAKYSDYFKSESTRFSIETVDYEGNFDNQLDKARNYLVS